MQRAAPCWWIPAGLCSARKPCTPSPCRQRALWGGILPLRADKNGVTGPRGSSVQFSSVAQSCPTLCEPMGCSTPGLPVHHQLPELTQTHVHRVSDAIQPTHPLSSLSPPAFNLSQHQGLLQRVSSSHQVSKVLEFQLQQRDLGVAKP